MPPGDPEKTVTIGVSYGEIGGDPCKCRGDTSLLMRGLEPVILKMAGVYTPLVGPCGEPRKGDPTALKVARF
jgi:hypothetical protein